MRSASLSRDGKALGGKSVLVTAKGILNRLPSELTAQRWCGWRRSACDPSWVFERGDGRRGDCRLPMGGGATAGDAVGAGGAFTGFGVARALGGAIADLEVPAAARRESVLSVLPLPSGPRGQRFTAGASGLPERAKRLLAVASTLTLDGRRPNARCFGPADGFSTLVSRFSRVIEAGAGGDTARVGAGAGGTIGRLVTLRD